MNRRNAVALIVCTLMFANAPASANASEEECTPWYGPNAGASADFSVSTEGLWSIDAGRWVSSQSIFEIGMLESELHLFCVTFSDEHGYASLTIDDATVRLAPASRFQRTDCAELPVVLGTTIVKMDFSADEQTVSDEQNPISNKSNSRTIRPVKTCPP